MKSCSRFALLWLIAQSPNVKRTYRKNHDVFLRIVETRASTTSRHVRHVAIFSMQIKIWSWGTYLDITCDEFVDMSIRVNVKIRQILKEVKI